MRSDSLGFFWQDLPQERVRGERVEQVRPMPPIPDTGWHPPSEFPRLEAADVISLDVETKDPHLPEMGPGTLRKDGHIVGISVGTEDGERWYFPMRHEVGGGNMDADQVLRWASDELSRPNQTKVGANLMYDCEWLAAEGVQVAGPFIDVLYQEALLDEYAKSYALESVGQKYLGEGKVSNALYEWCAQAYGGSPNGKQRANIYRAPACLTGPYAESDVDIPLRVARAQQARLESEGLSSLARLENALIPMLLAMRRRGVRVDVAAAGILNDKLAEELEQLKKKNDVDMWSAVQIAVRCDSLGIPYPRTPPSKKHPNGNPSFVAGWLKLQNHEFLETLFRMRSIDKLRGTFIEGHTLGHLVNGRVHAQFHPLRGDDNGTVSGRFSSSLPNLQNVPNRDEILAPLIRGLYLPDEGEDWGRFDWSQIEYRLLVHYARGGGSVEARQAYRDDPTTDFHQLTNEWVFGGDPNMRKPAKNINFGLVYGMREKTMSVNLGRSLQATKLLFEMYHKRLPFVSATFEAAERVALNRGYTKTLLGRRSRFDLWESRKWDDMQKEDAVPLHRDAALTTWGPNIRRAYAYRALNRMLQGSAADIMKKAMVDIWESGICDVLGAPLLTVHDELDWSAPRTPEAQEALKEAHYIMEHCVELRVPLYAERETGNDWGHLH